MKGRIGGERGPQRPGRLGRFPPGDLGPGRGFRQADVARHVLIGRSEGNQFLIEKAARQREDRLRPGRGRRLHPVRLFPGGQKEDRRMFDPARPFRLPARADGQQPGDAASVRET